MCIRLVGSTLLAALLTLAVGSTVMAPAAAGDAHVGVVQQSPTSPLATTQGALAVDQALGETVLFGGSPGTVGRACGWNGTTWSMVGIAGWASCNDMQIAYDAATGSIVLFEGISGVDGESTTWE